MVVWLLAMLAAATVTQLIARTAMTEDDKRSAMASTRGRRGSGDGGARP
jgi:hypothetical protein